MSVRTYDRARAPRTARGLAGCFALSLILAGCSSLPVSGPTGHQIVKQQRDPKTGLHFHLVEVADFSDLPASAAPLPVPADGQPVPPTDIIGPGDILDISIYETGVPLFASSGIATNAGSGGFDSAAHVTNLNAIRVDDQGQIRFPFVGKVQAAGRTSDELQAALRKALRGMSQNPQVTVTISDSLTNSVIVGGEIQKAGRLTLRTNHETIGDVVSLAGGYRGDSKDLLLRVERGGQTQDFRLSDVMSGTDRDMVARPGDRIDVIHQPLSFAVMGAPGRVDQIGFSSPSMTLAEAVASAGGANPNLGDAKAIFVFRLLPGPDGKPLPTVYHLNMMRAGTLFLSQRFAMQDKDVLYIGNAGFNQPSKLIQVVSQLFSPVVAIESGLVSSGAIK
ncbi:capsule biosynthesis protein [Nostoc sp. 3335mG]|nr:capsule biosynthesis protein [Nostoc sp. 3335mG]